MNIITATFGGDKAETNSTLFWNLEVEPANIAGLELGNKFENFVVIIRGVGKKADPLDF